MAKQKTPNKQADDEQLQYANKLHTDASKEFAEDEQEPLSVNSRETDEEEFSFAAAEEPMGKQLEEDNATPEQEEEMIAEEQEFSEEELLSEAERTRIGGKLHGKPDRRETMKGRNLPIARKARDPKMDKEPIPEKALGLPEDSFLMDRKVSPLDLKAQMKYQQRDFVGSNVRKPRDLARMFEKGKSTKADPKLDMSYSIKENYQFRKELIAQQLLRNLHSRDLVERRNSEKVLKEMEIDKELMAELKKDKKAFKNEEFITQIQDKVPHL